MLSRTAAQLFWMSRYLERAENLVRMLDVTHSLSLLPQSRGAMTEFAAPLAVTGTLDPYIAQNRKLDGEALFHYMALDLDNPASVLSCLKLARWMKPQKVRTPLFLQPAHGWIARQPLGVVGVISPWNYPVQLALAPAITALAAGNRVMLKPSELTPHTSAQLALLVAQFFAADEFCVVQGDAATAALVASLPFDHLVFTGSTAVGRKVAQAAAQHLTPTTLELGGKSPCIVDADCDMQDAALKIAHGKLLNAGQTCIAPDYVLLPRGREAEFSQAYQAAVARLFPSIEGNPDYASIITPRQ